MKSNRNVNGDLEYGSISRTVCNFWMVPHCVMHRFEDGTMKHAMNSYLSQHASPWKWYNNNLSPNDNLSFFSVFFFGWACIFQ